ncbi:MAG: addiction module protein [Polyangiales bacterium]
MSWPVEKILEEAFKLDAKDRALVVAELSSSEGIATPEEVEATWREEIARRVKSLEDGTAALHDWDEVNEEISSILKGA